MKLPHLLHIHFAESVLTQETYTILNKQESFTVSAVKVCDKIKINHQIIANANIIIIQLEKKHIINAKKLLQNIVLNKSLCPILILSNIQASKEVVDLIKIGANDFLLNPISPQILINKIKQWLDKDYLQKPSVERLKEKIGLSNIIGKSDVFLNEINKLPLFAKCDACVLINGETGTGKEIIARSIHYLSNRSNKPFVPVNCGAIPNELVENELFGHEKGAFTGASNFQKGLIQEANQGTLFLDEIDSLPLFSQVKFLRFLQDKEYRSLGSSKIHKADVRIIAASNTNLEDLVESGKLRLDLFYRLNVLQVLLPPLRQRLDDVPLLAKHFLEKYSVEFNKKSFYLSDSAIEKLQNYTWQGNVRELENVIERAVLLSENEVITDADIKIGNSKRDKIKDSLEENFQSAKAKVIEKFEKSYLQKILSTYHGNISQAAKAAGKNRRAFFELIRKYEINVENFRHER